MEIYRNTLKYVVKMGIDFYIFCEAIKSPGKF